MLGSLFKKLSNDAGFAFSDLLFANGKMFSSSTVSLTHLFTFLSFCTFWNANVNKQLIISQQWAKHISFFDDCLCCSQTLNLLQSSLGANVELICCKLLFPVHTPRFICYKIHLCLKMSKKESSWNSENRSKIQYGSQ